VAIGNNKLCAAVCCKLSLAGLKGQFHNYCWPNEPANSPENPDLTNSTTYKLLSSIQNVMILIIIANLNASTILIALKKKEKKVLKYFI